MNNHTFTKNDRNEALAFAYAMGLASDHESNEEAGSVLSFAQAMGLRIRPVREKKAPVVQRDILVPLFKFC